MVLLSVELGQGRSEVRAHLRHDLFAQVEHLRVGHATAVLDGFTFAFDGGGVLTVDGADVVIGAAAGPDCGTLAGAFRSASRRHFPASGAAPASAMFAAPQYNTWMEMPRAAPGRGARVRAGPV